VAENLPFLDSHLLHIGLSLLLGIRCCINLRLLICFRKWLLRRLKIILSLLRNRLLNILSRLRLRLRLSLVIHLLWLLTGRGGSRLLLTLHQIVPVAL
jgi:hypothetical protein